MPCRMSGGNCVNAHGVGQALRRFPISERKAPWVEAIRSHLAERKARLWKMETPRRLSYDCDSDKAQFPVACLVSVQCHPARRRTFSRMGVTSTLLVTAIRSGQRQSGAARDRCGAGCDLGRSDALCRPATVLEDERLAWAIVRDRQWLRWSTAPLLLVLRWICRR